MDNRKRRLVVLSVEIVYYAILIGFVWYVSSDTTVPFRPWFWHTVQRMCNRVAYRVGRVGIYAEHAYGTAIDRVRQ